MADKSVDKKFRSSASALRRGGFFIFTCSVAVGATAVGAYYLLLSGDSKHDLLASVKHFVCSHLQCCSDKSICGEWNSAWDSNSLSRYDNVTVNANGNTPPVTRHLVFVRHGQYKDNFKSDNERMLTDIGRQQATLTGRRLREAGIKFDIVVHSTMRRAVETADLIAKELSLDESTSISLSHTDLLREGSPIVPTPYYGKSITGKDQERIEAAFANFFHRPPPSQTKDTYELYVCHANVIRYLVLRALQLAPSAWLRLSIAHASITWLTIRSDGTVSLRRLGDSGHMPIELDTR